MGMDIFRNEFIGFCFHSSSDFSEMSKETQQDIKDFASFQSILRQLSEELELDCIQRTSRPDVVCEVAIGLDFGRQRRRQGHHQKVFKGPSRQELSEAKSKIKAKLPEINKRLGTDFKMKDLVRDCWIEVSV